MLNFIGYLADNTKLIKIWNKLPQNSKKIIFSLIINIWLFPAIIYKIYYFIIPAIYPKKKLEDIKIEHFCNTENIKKTNYNLVANAMLNSNFFRQFIIKNNGII